MKYSEVWLADLSPTVGSEQSGTRPVVIISNDDFNSLTKMRTIVPFSSQEKYKTNEFWATFPLIKEVPEGEVVEGFALCNQYKIVDLSRRKKKLLGKLSKDLTDEISTIVNSTIGDE
jgi:mRNA-degrading endonuclease toxin of MazEF toxin-antitoxin module